MFVNALPTEQVALLGTIDPASLGAGAANSGWVDLSKFESIRATVLAGVLGASATVDAKLEQATTASGTGVKDIPGKAITQITANAVQAEINCRAEELDINAGYRFARLVITVGVAASQGSGVIYGFHPRLAPASDHDLASVAQIVS